MTIDELSFKSTDNSTNKANKDWAILSVRILENKSDIKLATKYCFCRKIAYLDSSNKAYQTGSLYIPVAGFRYILFFLRLMLSRKTFGHFVSIKYPGKYRFKLISVTESANSDHLLLKSSSKIKVSKRVLFVPQKKMKFYVEEELEVN